MHLMCPEVKGMCYGRYVSQNGCVTAGMYTALDKGCLQLHVQNRHVKGVAAALGGRSQLGHFSSASGAAKG